MRILTGGSTTGLLIGPDARLMVRYNEGMVLWRSKMQKTVSLSNAKAEYYAAGRLESKYCTIMILSVADVS